MKRQKSVYAKYGWKKGIAGYLTVQQCPASSASEFLNIAHHKDEQDDQRQADAEIITGPGREFDTLSGVRFSQEIFPAPAVAAGTEEQIADTSQRQQVIGYDKVLQILNGASFSQRSKSAPEIKAQHAGKGQDKYQHQVHENRFAPGPTKQIDEKADHVLENSDDGGKGGETHEKEKESAEKHAAGHLIEDIGKRDEYKPGPFPRIHVESEAGGKNYQA